MCSSPTFVDYSRLACGIEEARRRAGPLSVSVVTVTEIARGMRSAERSEVRRLLGSLRRYPVTEDVAWKAAELMRSFRRSHSGIGLVDYLVAVTAQTQGLDLATLNTNHFQMFPDLAPPFRL